PFNLRIAGVEIPVGLGATTALLGATAIVNLFSKRVATIYGLMFTVVLFAIFTFSEHVNRRKHSAQKHGLEEFNLDLQPEVAADSLKAKPGAILVAVRDVNNLSHLRSVVHKTNMRRHDIVVMTVRQVSTGAGEYQLAENQLFTDYERELFSKVVEMAEKEGKTVELLVVPSVDPFEAIVQTAQKLQASRVVTGESLRMDREELARRIGLAWERLPEPRHAFSLEVLSIDKPPFFVNLGPHPPRLWPEDVQRLHDVWLRLSQGPFGSRLHHRDVLGVALRRFERDLGDESRRDVALSDLESELHHH
ncbi:MAG: APC family permease, partial [Acidobacteriota bacterium]|nr:APC family permease [Acidobacteriota bacterium]